MAYYSGAKHGVKVRDGGGKLGLFDVQAQASAGSQG
jgi:hypothetical protein